MVPVCWVSNLTNVLLTILLNKKKSNTYKSSLHELTFDLQALLTLLLSLAVFLTALCSHFVFHTFFHIFPDFGHKVECSYQELHA